MHLIRNLKIHKAKIDKPKRGKYKSIIIVDDFHNHLTVSTRINRQKKS